MASANHQQLPVWDRLSYDCDAIVEASAGTGKTYTLEHIVLKLVLEREFSLKEILLVTYTEKAAGELRDRIRGSFHSALKDLVGTDPATERKRERLQDEIRCFDEASISTIHSFCQRLLREYAFENGVPMATNVVTSMDELAARAVREVLLSKKLRQCIGNDFVTSIGLLTNKMGVDAFVGSMASRLASFRSERWDRPLEELAPVAQAMPIAQAAEDLSHALGGVPLFQWASGNQTIYKSDQGRATKDYADFEPLLSSLLDPQGPGFGQALVAYANLEKKANYLNPRVTGNGRGARLLDSHPELPDFLTSLNAEIARMRQQVLQPLFSESLARLRELRAEGAYLSYDDMVLQARDALFGPCRDLLLTKLRETYKVALVDEFQDTDGVQWDIFRTIFSASPKNPGHFLIVVGDPKQAIYGFRGADLQTYLEARDVIDASGQHESIDASYRSTPGMIDALNVLFSSDANGDGWFAGTNISYVPVVAPPDNVRFQPVGTTASALPAPVELLESLPPTIDAPTRKGFGNASACLPVFAKNAVREIKRLLAGGTGSFLVYDAKAPGGRRPLRYDDFAFLVRSTKNADPIKKALRQENIPYSHYKEAGVYASEEGEVVLALLELVADPTRPGKRAAALLTPAFGVPPDQLEEALQENAPFFTRLLDKWSRLATERRWTLLFESFVEDTRLWHPLSADDVLYDRRLETIRQILDDLLVVAGSSAQSVEDLATALRQLRSGDKAAGEEAGLRQKETEEDCVQIMTMHAAKGLEFPVVFIAYGFSKDPSPMFKLLTGDGDVSPLAGDPDVKSNGLVRRRLFHMDGSPLAEGDPCDVLQNATDNASDEVKRLLYVALTRAEYKLYLPWSARADADGIGSAGSPLREGFFCHAICKLIDEGLVGGVLAPASSAAGGNAPSPRAQAVPAAGSPCPVLLPDLPDGLRGRRVRWDSFSSIHHASGEIGSVATGPEKQQTLDGPEKEADEPVSAQEEVAADLAPHPTLLPRGTASGTVFHELMEDLCNADGTEENPGVEIGTLPFAELFSPGKGAVVLALAERLLRIHGLANREDEASGDTTAKTLVRMAWNALRASITVGATTFRLADLPPGDRRAEVDFVVDQAAVLGAGPNRNGLFNGSIDLLFRLPGQNRYFILDWKTNSLPAYGDAEVRAAMDAAGYHLQYQLYTLAASAWLGADCLAGATYLFVRGGEIDQGVPGVYACPFAGKTDGDQYRKAVSDNLDAARRAEDNR